MTAIVPLKLRLATYNDVRQIALWNHAMNAEEAAADSLTLPELENQLRDWIVSGKCTVHVFERGAEGVGFASWGSHGPYEVFVRQFYVAPAARRQGVGRAAVALLRQGVWPRRARVSLRVLVGSLPYLNFWRACGFSDFALTLEQLP